MSDGPEIRADDINYTVSGRKNSFLAEEKTMKEYTIQIIQHYLKKYDSNVTQIAGKLDIGKSTIYKMIQQKEISL
jgi:transcriptional regulator with PAS, ATPase and Fis domain